MSKRKKSEPTKLKLAKKSMRQLGHGDLEAAQGGKTTVPPATKACAELTYICQKTGR